MLERMVLTWLTTGRGGAECSVAELASTLAAYGMSVHLVWWRDSDGAPAPTLTGVRVQEVTSPQGYSGALAATLDQHAVIVSSHRTALVDLEVAGPCGIPVIAVLRAVLEPGEALRVVDPDTMRIVACPPEGLAWRRLRALACWVGVSHASAVSLSRCAPGPVPVQTIYNGVYLHGSALRSPTAESSDPVLRCVAVARAARWKRLDTLVSTFALLPAGTATLDVYGEGPLLGQHRAAALGAGAPVTFHGHVEDLHARVSDAHVLVSASLLEGFGRGVAEAAALGLPAVVPRGGASAEMVLHGLTGWVYDPLDPFALPRLLNHVAARPRTELAAMGHCAHTRAGALFTPARCAAEYLSLCHAVAAQPDVLPCSA